MTQLDARQEPTRGTKRKNNNWWIWLLLALVSLIVVWYILDQQEGHEWQEQPAPEAIDRQY